MHIIAEIMGGAEDGKRVKIDLSDPGEAGKPIMKDGVPWVIKPGGSMDFTVAVGVTEEDPDA